MIALRTWRLLPLLLLSCAGLSTSPLSAGDAGAPQPAGDETKDEQPKCVDLPWTVAQMKTALKIGDYWLVSSNAPST